MIVQERKTDDSWLQELHREKLIELGWAGELTTEELAHIKSGVKKSPSLRRRWGFRPTAKRFSEKKIRAVGTDGVARKGQF